LDRMHLDALVQQRQERNLRRELAGFEQMLRMISTWVADGYVMNGNGGAQQEPLYEIKVGLTHGNRHAQAGGERCNNHLLTAARYQRARDEARREYQAQSAHNNDQQVNQPASHGVLNPSAIRRPLPHGEYCRSPKSPPRCSKM